MVALFVWGIVAMTIGASATLREHWRLSGDVFSYMNPRVVTLDHWLSWLELSIASGWARFGWMNVAPSPWMGQLWWLTVSLLVILGMYRWWTGGAAGKRWLTSVFCLWAVGVFAAYLRINLTVLQPQFRFLMALIPILAVFAGGGVRKITPASQFAPMAVGVGLSVLLTAMNLWLVFGVIVPFYDIGL
jgi:hypothetical protein